MSSSSNSNVFLNLFLNSLKKYKGPPKKATFFSIFFPQARPVIV